MPLLINLRHLEKQDLTLDGELPAAELDLELGDEMIRLTQPLTYRIVVQQLEENVLVRGRIVLPLDCQCVRCLKPFTSRLELPGWTCLVLLSGEDKTPVIGDSVDLTPFLREDILLELPQHPLCKPDCGGLKKPEVRKSKKSGPGTSKDLSAWTDLDKLKF
jgi:uncharacterized metal-binding protein YceD (DUF177 family)